MGVATDASKASKQVGQATHFANDEGGLAG